MTDYILLSGEWDVYKIRSWFRDHVVDLITSLRVPCEESGEDKHIWLYSAYGIYSVKSGYSVIFASNAGSRNPRWRHI